MVSTQAIILGPIKHRNVLDIFCQIAVIADGTVPGFTEPASGGTPDVSRGGAALDFSCSAPSQIKLAFNVIAASDTTDSLFIQLDQGVPKGKSTRNPPSLVMPRPFPKEIACDCSVGHSAHRLAV